MQKLITKYGLAAHLAFLAVAPLFLSPVCVLWLSLLGLTWLVMEPSRIGDEMLHDARRRVFAAAVRDPLFWVFLAVVAFTAVRALNDGVAMVYDSEAGSWILRGPAMAWFPGVTKDAGGAEFAVSLALSVVVMGCRLALGRSARQAFLVLLSVLTGLLGLVLAYLHFDGSESVRALSVFRIEVPMHVGMVFGLGLLATGVAMISAFELVWRTSILLLILAFAGNLAALAIFAPVWTLVVFLAAALLLLAFAFVYAKFTLSGNNEFKYLIGVGFGIALAVVVAVLVVTEKPLLEKVEAVRQGAVFPQEYATVRTALADVSERIWKDHPWVGTGLGSFPLAVRFAATREEWRTIPPEPLCSPNGYWQFLVERGIVSAFVALCPLLLLLYTYVSRLVVGVRFRLPPPAAWVGLVALVAVLVLMAADSSPFYPGVSMLTAALLAVSANTFPKEKVHG